MLVLTSSKSSFNFFSITGVAVAELLLDIICCCCSCCVKSNCISNRRQPLLTVCAVGGNAHSDWMSYYHESVIFSTVRSTGNTNIATEGTVSGDFYGRHALVTLLEYLYWYSRTPVERPPSPTTNPLMIVQLLLLLRRHALVTLLEYLYWYSRTPVERPPSPTTSPLMIVQLLLRLLLLSFFLSFFFLSQRNCPQSLPGTIIPTPNPLLPFFTSVTLTISWQPCKQTSVTGKRQSFTKVYNYLNHFIRFIWIIYVAIQQHLPNCGCLIPPTGRWRRFQNTAKRRPEFWQWLHEHQRDGEQGDSRNTTWGCE